MPWEFQFVQKMPGDPETRNFTRGVKSIAYSLVHPTPVSSPQLVAWSDDLAQELGISKPTPEDRDSLDLLAGNLVLPRMKPYAARYGGHQFGNWAGQLGDGRAITLGEIEIIGQGPFEFQLKGAGPTPYSRRGDGRAVLRSSIREFLCSEAMHALGVPTTRALSLVSTGDEVMRDLFYDGNPALEPGAIVCRVSPSFLRFGNFEILAHSKEFDLLKKLADFTIDTHFPELELQNKDVYALWLDEIARRTAVMTAHWMRVGFVHGVMNTDNFSVLGLTLDYGPYGWLEPFDPNWTPNTTDAEGRRYRFGDQPNIALWNLMRFAESLYPLIQNEERVQASLKVYQDTFQKNYGEMMAQKVGLISMESEEDQVLVSGLFQLLQGVETDFTILFRSLCDWKAHLSDPDGELFLALVSPAFYSPLPGAVRDAWIEWSKLYTARLKQLGETDEQRSARMKKVNPKYVPRNYLAQNASLAAEKGDFSVLDRLMRVLKRPYDEQPGEEDLAQKRPEWARNAPGCSALSCSS